MLFTNPAKPIAVVTPFILRVIVILDALHEYARQYPRNSKGLLIYREGYSEVIILFVRQGFKRDR
jgi:hypothetical protein